jgi:transposase-like protein
MAISLKKYDRQVGVSAETGTQAIGGGLASAMIQEAGADAQTLATVANALGDASDAFFEHKAKGEVAKYEAYKQEWANELEVKKQQGLLEGELKATDLYDKVVIPEQMAFEKWVSDQGFSALARQQIDLDVVNFGKKVNVSERLNLLKLQTEESNYNVTLKGQNNLISGLQQLQKLRGVNPKDYTEEQKLIFDNAQLKIKEGNDDLNSLQGKTKPGVVESLIEDSYKKYYLSEVRFLNDEYDNQNLSFFDLKQNYLDLKKDIEKDAEEGIINKSSIQDINLELDAKIQNAAKRERASIKTDIKNISDGLFDDEKFIDFNNVRNLYIKNEALGSYIDNNIMNSLEDYSLVNDNAKKAIELLEKGSKEDGIAFTKILNELSGLGEVGNVTMMLALNYAEQNLDNDEEFIAYTTGLRKKTDVTISITPEFKDYFSTLKYFILDQKQSKYDSFASQKLKEFVKWQLTDEDYSSFRKKQFGSFAKEIALKQNIFEEPTTTTTKTLIWDNL